MNRVRNVRSVLPGPDWVYERAMRNPRHPLKACLAVGASTVTAIGSFVACGGGSSKPDAQIVLHDAPIDQAHVVDAAPDARAYDFSCFGSAQGSSAADPISISGVATVGQGSGSGVTVKVFKTGVSVATNTTTTAADGSFTISNIVTGGAPFDGYLTGTHGTDRLTYLYPAFPILANLMNVPLPILDAQTEGLLGLTGHTQDDTGNGMIGLAITDCAETPIAGATPLVQQGGSDVGEEFDASTFDSRLAGTYIYFNVPDGATTVGASYMGMTFPTHVVAVHKKTNGSSGVTSITETQTRPGPC